MTNKEKALMLVWEHWNTEITGFAGFSYEMFILYLKSNHPIPVVAIQHAKLTASKIAEYNPEEGKAILEELEKI